MDERRRRAPRTDVALVERANITKELREKTYARVLQLKRSDPDLDLATIATRTGISMRTASGVLAAHGLSARSGRGRLP